MGLLVPVIAYQAVRGAVMLQLALVSGAQFRHDVLRQRLSELHAPLVKGINVPDDALDENFMLVQGDELPQQAQGVSCSAMMVVVGRFPSKVRYGTRASGTPSLRSSSADLPKARASVWAKKFAMSFR